MADYLSINEFPGDGTIMQIEVQFAGNNPDVGSGAVPYFKPEDVKAQFFTPATATTPQIVEDKPLGYVGPNTFITLEPVPTGKILRVYRETEDRFSLVNFVALQNVTERDLDALARQTVFLVEEAKDAAQFAIDTAREAIKYATSSTVIANEALVLATAADAASKAAVQAAALATGTANDAKAIAIEAADDAAAAEEHATNVEVLAADAQAKADTALATANRAETKGDQAISTANAIDAKAQTAIDTANQATATANSAKSTAEAIDGKATQAIATANSAASTAADAKATAEAIDAKATEALSTAGSANDAAMAATTTANQAKATAESANANVAGKVNKAGDTMTGQLLGPAFQTSGVGASTSGPRFEMHWPGQSAGMMYLNNAGQITWGQTGGNGISAADYTHINMSDGYFLHRRAGRFMGTLTVDGGLYSNQWNPQSGTTLIANGILNVNNSIIEKTGVIRIRASGAVNAHLFFENADASERVLMYADTANNLNIRTSAGPTLATFRNTDKGLTVTGGINSANLYAAGRVQGGEVLSTSKVYAASGSTYLNEDGNIYGGTWGGWLSNWVNANYVTRGEVAPAIRANVASWTAGQVGTYALLQNRGSNGDPDAIFGGDQLAWASSAGDFNAIVGYGQWRLMGQVRASNKVTVTSVWLRIA